MRVNAYTTFDLLDATVEGHGFTESAPATLNVSVPRGQPDHVRLELEVDNVELETVRPHSDSVSLSATQARTLAAELESYAADVETAASEQEGKDD